MFSDRAGLTGFDVFIFISLVVALTCEKPGYTVHIISKLNVITPELRIRKTVGTILCRKRHHALRLAGLIPAYKVANTEDFVVGLGYANPIYLNQHVQRHCPRVKD